MKQSDKENSLKIIYLDNHLLLVSKEANLLTQPDNTKSKNLQDMAKKYLKKKFNKKGEVFLHPIHRLDKKASGIILFARTSKALSRLNEQSREKEIKRTYIAEVEGHLEKATATLKNYLVHSDFKATISSKENKKAKEAILHYKVLEEKKDSTIVEIELKTGRYHQIRVQFAYINHPIVGDGKYKAKKNLNKIKLHHKKIKFLHPITKKILTFESKESFLF